MSFDKKWRLMPPREHKLRENKIYLATIVIDEEKNNTCIVYSTNTTILEHLVKLHNASLAKQEVKK